MTSFGTCLAALCAIWLFCGGAAPPDAPLFQGKIVYSCRAYGADSSLYAPYLAPVCTVETDGVKTLTTYGSCPLCDLNDAQLLTDGATGESWLIQHKLRQYWHFRPESYKYKQTRAFRATGASKTIQGYDCRRFESSAELIMMGGKVRVIVWAASRLPMVNQAGGNAPFPALQPPGLSGAALRKEIRWKDRDLKIIWNAELVEEAAAPPTLELPQNYRARAFDPMTKTDSLFSAGADSLRKLSSE